MEMLRLRLLLIGLTLFACVAHARPAPRAPQDSVVFVFSRGISQTSVGNGFAIGDGTLIVTARHVVYPLHLAGSHQGEAMVTILSPYLGDASEADVIAQDPALDLIVLRATAKNWKGHPALELADEAAIVEAEQARVIAYTTAQSAVAAGQPKLLVSWREAQIESTQLPINAITVRQAISRTVLTETAPPGGGWAGAPLLLPGSDLVAGCFSRTQANGTAATASAAGSIRKLLDLAGASTAPASTGPTTRPSQSPEATLQYLRAIASSAAGDSKQSLADLDAFLKLRPGSAIGYRESAGQLHALRRLAESQITYAKALELDPALISARVLYGQLLQQRVLPGAAEEHLRYAWTCGRGSTAAVIPLCNLLREQGKEAERLKILTEAVQRNPWDSYLWNYLGQSRRLAGDHSGAAAAFARAADLLPENESIRFAAAEEFEAAGKDTQAGEQYRLLVSQHDDSAAVHYYLARFLGRNSARRDEAIEQAQMALALADRPGAPPRNVIQSLISAIRAGRSSDASDFRL